MTTKPLSKCCASDLIVRSSDEGTSYYECSSCHKAADIWDNQVNINPTSERALDKKPD